MILALTGSSLPVEFTRSKHAGWRAADHPAIIQTGVVRIYEGGHKQIPLSFTWRRTSSARQQCVRGASDFPKDVRGRFTNRDRLRHFEICQIAAQRNEQLLWGDRMALPRHHSSTDHLAPLRLRDGKNDSLLHVRKAVDQVLHPGGVHVKAW